MIQQIVLFQEIVILHIDYVVLDHLKIHIDQMKVFVFHIVFVIDNSIPIELPYVEGTLKFITNEETLVLLNIFLSDTFAIVPFSMQIQKSTVV